MPRERLLLGVARDPVVARDPGRALPEPPDRLGDLVRLLQVARLDACPQRLEIREQPVLLRFADRPVLRLAAFTAAEAVDLVALLPVFDLDAQCRLHRVAGRGGRIRSSQSSSCSTAFPPGVRSEGRPATIR